MKDINATGPSRRRVLQAALALAAVPATVRIARAQSRPVTTVQGFETGADVAKAEAEGEVLFYTHDSDPAGAALMQAFSKDFPKIKGSYLRAQTGALYSKILAERSAGRFAADVIQFSEVPHRDRLPEARRLRALRLAAGEGLPGNGARQPAGLLLPFRRHLRRDRL